MWISNGRNCLKAKARSSERTANQTQIRSELRHNVFNYPIVRSSRSSQDRNIRWKSPENPDDALIIRSEIVPPVGDAMRFIDYEQADASCHGKQTAIDEVVIRQSFSALARCPSG